MLCPSMFLAAFNKLTHKPASMSIFQTAAVPRAEEMTLEESAGGYHG